MGEAASASEPDTRSYEEAVAILRSRVRKKRPDADPIDLGTLADRIPDGKAKLDVRGTPSSAGFPRKMGLYTSPHLVGLFAKYLFEIWEPLSQSPKLPRYLQLLFMLAVHTFIREGVDTAIIETHHGGEYDATNETIDVLEERAVEKEVLLRFVVGDDPDLPCDAPNPMPDVQRSNCALALAALEDIEKGVESFHWLRRFQHISWGTNAHWFLDGAHNEMSVGKAADCPSKYSPLQQTLIFNQHSDERDPAKVMGRLSRALQDARVDHVIFANYNPHRTYVTALEGDELESKVTQDQVQTQQFTGIWNQSQPQSVIHASPYIQHAMLTALNIGNACGGMHTLITGSLHLVGGAMNFLAGLGSEEA
ncbi:folylpolyglutamate synthase [Apiospora sp. TS-2023a]